MDSFRRYAVYIVPSGALEQFGAGWLGWDIATGQPAPQPDYAGLPRTLADLTAVTTPYGLHATIKPPFRLADGADQPSLLAAMDKLTGRLPPLTLDGLALTDLDGFLALTPLGDVTALNALAADIVRTLDPFRGPATDSELTRRRAAGLSAAQEANLQRWGYPYVMDEFGCHITLTGRLTFTEAAQTRAILAPLLAPLPLAPYPITDLALVGQTQTGRFKLIHRYPLTG